MYKKFDEGFKQAPLKKNILGTPLAERERGARDEDFEKPCHVRVLTVKFVVKSYLQFCADSFNDSRQSVFQSLNTVKILFSDTYVPMQS